MRDDALLINTARAELIDHEALVEVVRSGRLGGIALDVFHGEPPDPDDPLVAHPSVLPTPHLAAWTQELTDHHSRTIVEEILCLLEGRPFRNVVNPEVWS